MLLCRCGKRGLTSVFVFLATSCGCFGKSRGKKSLRNSESEGVFIIGRSKDRDDRATVSSV